MIPESNETMFDILRSRGKDGVDVCMVVWQPAMKTADTIPDPSPVGTPIQGVNGDPELFKRAGIRRTVISACISHLAAISSLFHWTSRRN